MVSGPTGPETCRIGSLASGVRYDSRFMAESYTILFLGDVVGEPGRLAVQQELPRLMAEHQPLFVIVNGENSAGGVGITPKIADQMFSWGADVITLGNHAFNKREIGPYLDTDRPIIRPANMAPGVPGRGVVEVAKDGIRLAVLNLCGRVMMDPHYGDPFSLLDEILSGISTPHRFLDFHAEATSEKIGMGYHGQGRLTAVIGTHTHVTTADEAILPGGTAYLTDVGMCGPTNSVLGMDREIILNRFRTGLPQRFEVGREVGVISGVVLRVERSTGRATRIERVRSEPAD